MAYEPFALCTCGYFEYAPFGKVFHTARVVCPRCGRDVGYWRVVTARRQSHGFLGLRTRLVSPEGVVLS